MNLCFPQPRGHTADIEITKVFEIWGEGPYTGRTREYNNFFFL